MLGSLLLLILSGIKPASAAGPTAYAEWASLNYTWDAQHSYQEYLDSGKFVVVNNAVAGIKLDSSGNIYVSVPRWREGIPATLNRVVESADGNGYDLQPFPSWDMQQEGVAGDLQNCQSMLIDSQDRMWVIEVGRKYFLSDSPTVQPEDGPAGVWIIDVKSGAILSKYYFPDDVASYNTSFVNDLVLDEERQVAYLTDANGDGGIIVYDYANNESRRYVGPSTGRDPNYEFYVNGEFYGTEIFTTPVDGIAISSDLSYIYYCAVQGAYLYRLPTAILRDFNSTWDEIDTAVVNMGYKPPSDGIDMWDDVLYYGSLPESTYYALNMSSLVEQNLTDAAVPIWPDAVTMRWVDTFSKDPSDPEKLWFVSNGLDRFIVRTMDFSGLSGPNFRVMWTTKTDLGWNDCTCDDPKVTSSSNDDDLAESAELLLALTVIFGVLFIAAAGVALLVFRSSKTTGTSTQLSSNLL